jgi:hypothetical protein
MSEARRGRLCRWRRWRRAAALVLLLVLAAPVGQASAPAPLALRYEVYARGFPILALDFQINETAADYSVSGLIRTIGVVDWIVGFAMHSASWGTIAADQLRPSLHESSSHSPRGGDRRTHLDYAPDGTVAAALIPPAEPGQPSPTAQQTAGTLDPLSAILTIHRAVVRLGSCDIRVPVFDGRRRYDLVLADDGKGLLAAASTGEEGWHCKVDMVKIAGFAAEHSGTPHSSNEGEVWIRSPAAGAPPVPLRIDFMTDWGPLTVQMSPVGPTP